MQIKGKAAGHPGHPPYVDMIKEALVTLKERNGSSQQALKKFIGGKYKLPQGWEKTLSVQLKRLVEDGKLVRVKASYKLGEQLKKTPAKPKKVVAKKPAAAPATPAAKPAAKPKAKKPAKKAAAKPKKAAAPATKAKRGAKTVKGKAKKAAKPAAKKAAKKTGKK